MRPLTGRRLRGAPCTVAARATGRGRHVPACPRHTDPALFRCAQLGQRLARLRGGPPPPSPGSRKPPSCPLAQRPPQTLSSDGAPQAGAPRAGQKPRPGVRAPGGGASGDRAEEQLSPRQTKATRNYSSRPPDTEINESDNPGSGRSAPCGRGLPSTCAQRSRSLRGQWPRSPLRPRQGRSQNGPHPPPPVAAGGRWRGQRPQTLASACVRDLRGGRGSCADHGDPQARPGRAPLDVHCGPTLAPGRSPRRREHAHSHSGCHLRVDGQQDSSFRPCHPNGMDSNPGLEEGVRSTRSAPGGGLSMSTPPDRPWGEFRDAFGASGDCPGRHSPGSKSLSRTRHI